MNYLSILMVISGLFLSTTADTPSKINFEKHTDVDRQFVDFLSAFEKVNLPYEMDIDDVAQLTETTPKYMPQQNELLTKYIMDEKGNSKLSKISRFGPPIITPLNRFYPTEETVAVTYARQNRFGVAYSTIMIAVYNLKGKLLSFKAKLRGDDKFSKSKDWNHLITETNNDQTQSFKITEDGMITINTYHKEWKNDWKEHGIDNNEVIETELVSQEMFSLDSRGEMVSLHKIDYEEVADIATRP